MPKPSPLAAVLTADWQRDLIENAPETILLLDESGTILFHHSDVREAIHGEVVGRRMDEFLLPAYRNAGREKMAQLFATGQADAFEFAAAFPGGGEAWYSARLAPVVRAEKVAALALFLRNATPEWQAQSELIRANAVLEKTAGQRAQALEQYVRRMQEVRQLSVALRKASTTREVTEILADQIQKVIEVDVAGVYLLQDNELHYAVSLGKTEAPPPRLTPEHDPFLFKIMEANQLRHLALNEQTSHPGCRFCSYIHGQGIKSLVVAPLHTGETIVGVLFLGARDGHEILNEDEQLISAFVESSSNTLHRILLMEQLEQNLQQQEKELKILYEVMTIASEETDSQALLARSLAVTLAAVQCETGVIHLLDLSERRLKVAAEQAFPAELHNYLLLSGAAENLWEKVFQEQKILSIQRLKSQSIAEGTREQVQLYDYLGVPIRVKENPIGVLSLFSGSSLVLDGGQIQLIRTIADQIGLALETTSQRKRENEALIFEERQRLARELHDSVSQSLYGLVLAADVGNKLLKVKAYPELSKTLQEIGNVTLQALKEMRLMLFELRPVALETIGLAGALELRLNTVEKRANLRTSLRVTGEENIPRGFDLEVYRIATEALNNSLKHSRASEVNVTLTATPKKIDLVIKDNGVGFDPAQKPLGGLGLATMQERCNRIHGQLVIESRPKSGARIKLSVPVQPVKPARRQKEPAA